MARPLTAKVFSSSNCEAPTAGGVANVSDRRFPGDLILLPAATVSLAILIVNDHVLKERYGNTLTGKLSDFAGLVFFPLLLAALLEVARAAFRLRAWRLSTRGLTVCVLVTGSVFALAKTWEPANYLYRAATAALEWPVIAIKATLLGSHLPAMPATHLVLDATDLIALPFLLVPWWFGRRSLLSP